MKQLVWISLFFWSKNATAIILTRVITQWCLCHCALTTDCLQWPVTIFAKKGWFRRLKGLICRTLNNALHGELSSIYLQKLLTCRQLYFFLLYTFVIYILMHLINIYVYLPNLGRPYFRWVCQQNILLLSIPNSPRKIIHVVIWLLKCNLQLYDSSTDYS